MNTRQVIDESGGPVSLSVAFNQESNCFAVGLDSGFCIFNSDPCELKVSRDFNAGIGIVEMLGRSNYIALVGGGKQPKFPQNKVIIWDDSKQKAVITLEFRTPVVRVRLSRARIVVALQNSVHIYAFSSPPEKVSVFETADNLCGLCGLGARTIVFPGRTPGQVQLVEIATGNVSIIPAHVAPLRALELSPDGEILATASETGTLIKVFSARNCSRIAELRRGIDQAIVFSMRISPDGGHLAVTSDKATLHVFDLPSAGGDASGAGSAKHLPLASSTGSVGSNGGAGPNQKWGLVGKIPFLPRVFSDVYSFASAPFETADDPAPGRSLAAGQPARPIPGIPGGRPVKGVLGWLDECTILVIGAGRDGRWEKFFIGIGDEGKRFCIRDGWKRYLGS